LVDIREPPFLKYFFFNPKASLPILVPLPILRLAPGITYPSGTTVLE
jgi:hypothetical protein